MFQKNSLLTLIVQLVHYRAKRDNCLHNTRHLWSWSTFLILWVTIVSFNKFLGMLNLWSLAVVHFVSHKFCKKHLSPPISRLECVDSKFLTYPVTFPCYLIRFRLINSRWISTFCSLTVDLGWPAISMSFKPSRLSWSINTAKK